ncbi:hypothetical protein [Novosphingobium sp. FKTRR1]|uniref:hypothetical protein n=1 Tax=Novosphingobium sp. FKTRR1 TaxID=2879118 RepID=UPI001CF0C383|nr:hypothetical protein [Novosphingobium sp. FKTRR1]
MSIYNPSNMPRHNLARAEDVNRELSKISAAFEQLQAYVDNLIANPPEVIHLYAWRAYSNSADGRIDFTTGQPGTRSYIGLAFNKLVETAGSNPDDYAWSPISGIVGNLVAVDTLAVAGRPALTVLSDLDGLSNSLLAYQYDRQTIRDYVDAKLFVDGVAVNTVIVSESNQRRSADSALAETIALIGAKTPDGSAFIVDLNKTYVSPTISLGVRLSQIVATANDAVTGAQAAQASVQALAQSIATGDYAQASTLALLGSKTADGTAFQMNLANVKVSAAQSLSQYIGQEVATAAGSIASVTTLVEAVVTPQGTASAKAVLQLDVNGHVIGYSATNDGHTGQMTFTIDKFTLLDTGGNSLFIADAGGVKMHNVEVDTIKAGAIISDSLAPNAAALPVTISAASRLGGAGQDVFMDSLTINITTLKPAIIFATLTGAQSFPNGDRYYGNKLYIGGTEVFAVGGLKTLDSVTLSGTRYMPAGTHEIKHRWAGDGTVSLYGRTLFVLAIY